MCDESLHHKYCNIFCFLCFSIIILLVNNIFSYIALCFFFWLLSNKKSNQITKILLIISIIGLIINFYNNNFLIKFILIIDYLYYFIIELLFGLYKKSRKNYIKIERNTKEEIKRRYLNFDKLKEEIIDDKFDFNYVNGFYIAYHLFFLLIVMVIER